MAGSTTRGSSSRGSPWRLSSLILAAFAAGILTGFAEAAFLDLQRLVFGRIVFMGRHAWWMKPIAEGTTFAIVGSLVYALGSRFPALRAVRSIAVVSASLAVMSLLFMIPQIHRAAQLALGLGIGVQLGRLFARWFSSRERAVRIAAFALIGLVPVVGLVAHEVRLTGGPASGQAVRGSAPNVLLLVLDTVRARSLSVYGHTKPTTPNLERIAAEGVLFEHAIATSSWTLPSHASMFTGRKPHEFTATWRTPLDDAHPTVAEHLAAAGYDTGGFVANMGYAGWESGLARGFSHYEDYPVSAEQLALESTLFRWLVRNPIVRTLTADREWNRKSAAEVNAEFLDWQGKVEDRPFFAFLNYYDAHGPYMPPEPYRSRFADGEPRGRVSPLHEWLEDPIAGPPPAEDAIEQELWAYEASIAWLDDEIGQLVDELASRGVLDNTILIITSDHGEEFGEHGILDHGNSLYLDGVHVPLIIRHPNRLPAGRTVEQTVSLIDLPMTIVDLTGSGANVFPGESLAATTDTSGEAMPRAATAELDFAPRLPEWFPVSRGDMASFTDDRWHLIRNGDDRLELYSLDPDSSRLVDHAANPSRRQLVDSLAARLTAETAGGN